MKKLDLVGRKGGYDEEGNLIIPFDYVEICALNNGVYYARENFEEGTYHLYTAKGKVDFPLEITDLQWDNDKTLVAVKTNDEIWKLVEVDYENNILNIIYENCIFNVSQRSNDLVLLYCNNGEIELFSRKEKKIIASFNGAVQFYEVNEKGFICKESNGKSFWNLSGKKILDGFHNIKMYDDFLICIDKFLFWRLYSYTGKELNPYKYSGNACTDGIIPHRTQIDGEKVWLFTTNDKRINSEELTKKLETADAKCLICTLEQGAPIVVYEDIGNAILKEKKKQTLYKFEKDKKGSITAKVLFEADRIKRISNSSEFFEMWRGRKRGVCNKEGLLVEPFKWQLYKISYVRYGDIEH